MLFLFGAIHFAGVGLTFAADYESNGLLSARDMLEEMKMETYGDLYETFQEYLQREGYSDDEIEEEWMAKLESFGRLEGVDVDVWFDDIDRYKRGGHGGPGMKKGRGHGKRMPKMPKPIGSHRGRRSRGSEENPGDEYWDEYKAYQDVDMWKNYYKEDDGPLGEMFKNYLATDENGNRNGFGKFMDDMDELRDDMEGLPQKWFGPKKKRGTGDDEELDETKSPKPPKMPRRRKLPKPRKRGGQ